MSVALSIRYAVFALAVWVPTCAAQAQSLRFFAAPYEVYEGDAVVFNYLEADRVPGPPTVKLDQIDGWRWDFNGDGVWDEEVNKGDPDPNTGLPRGRSGLPLSGQQFPSIPANPSNGLAATSAGVIYDVDLTVTYTATYKDSKGVDQTSPTHTIFLPKKDVFRVILNPGELTLGRAYRIGFPATYGWDDIVKAYSATGSSLGFPIDNYVYFHHFEKAFFTQQTTLFTDLNSNVSAQTLADDKQAMAEIVNELLQGQTMIANQRLIEALRIKYPRISADVDPTKDRLNPPAGTREETAAIDTAILDYHAAAQYGAAAIRDYGTGILRSKAKLGKEPFPQFPLYLTFLDPTLSHDAPIPIKNEDWQLTTAFERMELGRVEKAKKLWRLSSQDATALPEAKAECKTAGTQAYLAMALLAAGQTESDYQANEGALLLAHVKNAATSSRTSTPASTHSATMEASSRTKASPPSTRTPPRRRAKPAAPRSTPARKPASTKPTKPNCATNSKASGRSSSPRSTTSPASILRSTMT